MNSQVKTTRSIWGMATGMLGICVALSPETHTGPLIPLAVLSAAMISTVTIWGSRGSKPAPAVEKLSPDQTRIKELEERLANLEAITNLELQLLDKKYPGAVPTAVPAPSSSSAMSAPEMTSIPLDSSAPVADSPRGVARPIAS